MKKLAGFIFILGIAFTAPVFAVTSMATFDFSHVRIDAPSDVNWNFYNEWSLAEAGAVDNHYTDGWSGASLERVAQGSFVKQMGFDGSYIDVHHIGITNDAATTFDPAKTPASCLVKLHDGDVLYIEGVIYISANNKPPIMTYLNCTLKS